MLRDGDGGHDRVIEYIRYEFPPGATDQFEAAYQAVGGLLTESPRCVAWELARGVENPGSFVVRIEWDSIEGHEEGFRKSPAYQLFFGTLSAFSAQRLEMAHYRGVNGSGAPA
jgi:heme-degrading monooxygenase HmoA